MRDEAAQADERDDFSKLLDQVRAGSQEAVAEFLDRYGPQVLRAVRRALAPQMRRQFDSTDFTQAVWASFFAVPEQLPKFAGRKEALAYLIRMARNKVANARQRLLVSQKRGIRYERAIEEMSPDGAEQLVAKQPSPERCVIEQESWEALLRRCRPHERRILQLRREGNTVRQIADELGLGERTIRRAIASHCLASGPHLVRGRKTSQTPENHG